MSRILCIGGAQHLREIDHDPKAMPRMMRFSASSRDVGYYRMDSTVRPEHAVMKFETYHLHEFRYPNEHSVPVRVFDEYRGCVSYRHPVNRCLYLLEENYSADEAEALLRRWVSKERVLNDTIDYNLKLVNTIQDFERLLGRMAQLLEKLEWVPFLGKRCKRLTQDYSYLTSK
jgi:hypothetical protein